jgi:glycosyltransferase involved in cell wall biosynthesis
MDQITALMPVKNGIHYLPSAREEVSKNCRSTDQILIVDDNSTDGTLEFLHKWECEDKRVKVIHNNGNGLVDALNLGIKESKFPWIARFDVDDLYSSDRLEKQRRYLNKTVAAIFCDYQFVDHESRNLGIMPSPVTNDAIKLSLKFGRRTPHPGVIFNREMSITAGMYRSDEYPAEDLGLWIRLSKLGELISTPQVLLYYRVSPNSITSLKQREMVIKRNEIIQVSDLDHTCFLKFHSINQLLNSYRDYPNQKERSMHFLIELLSAVNTFKGATRKIKIRGIVFYKLLFYIGAQTVWQSLRERSKRKELRSRLS